MTFFVSLEGTLTQLLVCDNIVNEVIV
jgi:hypothetical protein